MRMRSLWSEWPRIRKRLTGKNLILLLDYDGTLAPIVARPFQARLPAGVRAVLRRLAGSPRVALGVVSGRELSQLEHLIRLKNICYVGSHGLEWSLPSPGPHQRAPRRWTRPVREITKELRQALCGLPYIWIQRKISSVAVHYRGANSRHVDVARRQIARILRRHATQFRLLEGKKVFEFLPVGRTAKGTAVRALEARLRPRWGMPVVIYFGDDATDESVFASLGRSDLGVFVGRPRSSRARLYVSSPNQVRRFLERLSRIVL